MKFTKKFSTKVVLLTAVQVTVYSKSLNLKHIFSKNKKNELFDKFNSQRFNLPNFSWRFHILISSIPTNIIHSTEMCHMSPANCDPGNNELVTISIGYTRESGRPDASGACAGPHMGMKVFEWNPLIVRIDGSHLVFP